MKLKKTAKILTLAVAGLVVLAPTVTVGAPPVPRTISYQGYLTDSSGGAVNSTVPMTFALYDVASGGSALWSETVAAVPVIEGVYNVLLGSSAALEIAFDVPYYLGVAVGSDPEMTPRQPLASVPYALNSAALDGMDSGSFAQRTHTHAGSAIVSGTVDDARVAATIARDSEVMSIVLGADGPGSGLDADRLDGIDSGSFVQSGADYGRSGVSANLYEGTSTLTSRYVNEGQANSVTSAMIVDATVTAADLGANSVGPSEIAFPLSYTGTDLNGGLISMTNSSGGTAGNYPVGVLGQASGTAGSYRVVGVMGATPPMGSNAAISMIPAGSATGVAGASLSGNGVIGTSQSSSSAGVYGENTRGFGVYGKHTDPSATAPAVYGKNEGYGIGVLGDAYSTATAGVYGRGYGTGGHGVQGVTTSSTGHAGYFSSSAGVGLTGAVLYASNTNSSGEGIALWAKNDNASSTDAAAVISHNGTGPLLKGFGKFSGEHEIIIENDGTVEIFDGAHVRTVTIDPSEGTTLGGSGQGSQITLYNGTGAATIEIDGAYGGGSGPGRVTTGELQITGGADLSEQFDVVGQQMEILPGMVVSIDPSRPGKLRVSTRPYDPTVAGILSGAGGVRTGLMMGQTGSEADGALPVALTGRVYCLADATENPVRPGDLLTTSDVPGHAMRVVDHDRGRGAIIGKAMTGLESGRGMVLVLVSLQ